MTKNNNKEITIEFICDGKTKSIPFSKVDQKHFPPRQEGVIYDDGPATKEFLIQHIANSLRNECEEPILRKRQEEQLKAMEEYHKKQEEYRKKQAQSVPSPQARLSSFAKGQSCPFCYGFCTTLTCRKVCQAPLRVDISDAMHAAKQVLEENKQQKQQIEELKKEIEKLQQLQEQHKRTTVVVKPNPT
jgi:hypothetical protein